MPPQPSGRMQLMYMRKTLQHVAYLTFAIALFFVVSRTSLKVLFSTLAKASAIVVPYSDRGPSVAEHMPRGPFRRYCRLNGWHTSARTFLMGVPGNVK